MRERKKTEGGGGGKAEGENPQSDSLLQGVRRHGAQSEDPKIVTWAETKSWTPNQLSHPGTPLSWFLLLLEIVLVGTRHVDRHTWAHSYTHTHTHTLECRDTDKFTDILTQRCMHTYTHTHSHTQLDTETHHSHKYIQTHTDNSEVHTFTDTQTQTHRHTRVRVSWLYRSQLIPGLWRVCSWPKQRTAWMSTFRFP